MEDGSYTDATLAFVNWLQANGTTVSEKIDLVDLRNQGAGRGVGMFDKITSSARNPILTIA